MSPVFAMEGMYCIIFNLINLSRDTFPLAELSIGIGLITRLVRLENMSWLKHVYSLRSQRI